MLTLPNYQISTQIYESANSLVYRGLRKKDNQPVILKMLKENYPTPAELTRYRQEYEITYHFDLEGVIKVYEIEKYQNTLIIILEDFGGESLKLLMTDRPLTIKAFLPIAIQIADSLSKIHAANIIHKDINPSNIVMNIKTKQLKIIDFGIASSLPHENPNLKNPEQLEGTLAYISPEQTGRINRSMDSRTDLYSLGVTFYELLTGQVPFIAHDALELVHCHIAKIPPSVSQINRDIPRIISDIVIKLLAKNPEDRYQSAFGLKRDLEKCLALSKKVFAKSLFSRHFELAQNDFSGKFKIPHKLYGREQEVKILVEAFERVSLGQAEMILVAGYSGVGKTALVHEVHKPMTEKSGYFAAGKFEQFQKNIPYYSITQAFNEFCRYLLMENAENLAHWKTRILKAIGNHGQILIDVIPNLELVIGQQPPVPEVSAFEAQTRFNLFFLNFIKALCDKAHPFILFIDDLQWVDSASLGLLKCMMLDNEIEYLLIICAYRDNEVDSCHPFIMAVEELKKAAAIVNKIELGHLQKNDINQLLQDSLLCKARKSQKLAHLIYQKTQGNAFFIRQFLQSLYQEHLLHFDFNQYQWEWNIEQIENKNMTDNVIDLMIGQLKKQPKNTQDILRLAACVGNQFDLETLSIINEQSAEAVYKKLLPAIQVGLILPTSDLELREEKLTIFNYQFLHDRVQQAAYALINEASKKTIHLKIGQLLLAHLSFEERDNKLFKIVDHFNVAWTLVINAQEKLQLAELNLQAAKKAKSATAYEPAQKYLMISTQLLPENAWQLEYGLTYRIYLMLAEVAFLNKNFKKAESLYSLLLEKAITPLEKAQVYVLQIEQYQLLGQLDDVLILGKKALKLLGITIPNTEEALKAFIANESEEIHIENFEQILKNEAVSDPQIIATANIINNTMMSAFFAGEQLLHGALAYKQSDLSLKYGHTPFSAVGYASLGFFKVSALGEIAEGVKLGELGMNLIDRFQDKSVSCRTIMFYHIFLSHWHTHLKRLPQEFDKGFHEGLDSGDISFAGFNLMWKTATRFFRGESLNRVYAEGLDTLDYLVKTDNFVKDIFNIGIMQAILHLQGETLNTKTLSTVDFNEEKAWAQFGKIPVFAGWLYATKIRSLYFFEHYTALLALFPQFQLASFILATHQNFTVELYLYNALALIATEKNILEQEASQEKVEQLMTKMKTWAEICPINYAQQYFLVKAEWARISNEETGKVMRLYDLAIQTAKENEYLQFEALGNELAGKFWLTQDKTEFAQIYLTKAHYLYQLWGASAKVLDLENKYPKLLGESKSMSIESTPTVTAMASIGTLFHRSTLLDLGSVIKASQTLAGEIVLTQLLEKMMHIVIENAAAERGLLILEKEKGQSEWVIEAEGKLALDEVTVLQSVPIQKRLPITIVNYVIRTCEAVVLVNAMEKGIYTEDSYIQAHQLKSVLCAPILHQGQLIGILYLENNLIEGAFTAARLKIVDMLSSQAAISLENALLYQTLEQKVVQRTKQLADANQEITTLNDRLKEENLRMSAELDVAKQLQQMVLPKNAELQKIENLEIAGFMEPADEVGGDYYEVLSHDGHIKIGIGDVTGHGLESGVIMLMVQTTVRALLLAGIENPETFLNVVNRTIYHNAQRMETDKNLTLSLLDYEAGSLRVTGQHEEVLVVRQNGKIERIDTVELGFMVGVIPNMEQNLSHLDIQLQSGDGIVLYTDGITEARNPEMVLYGIERLCEVISQNWYLSAQEIQQVLVADVKEFIGAQKVFDDITLLILKQK
jgi:predicted ATPase/serine phosphatase RsbU (regulator of sigma subunit)/tRNA A-37 threonylcarbamoyl transferase component Bud32